MFSKSTMIIAEMANAHEGRFNLAKKIVDAAISAKADVVKFQIYFGNELVTRTHPDFDHFVDFEMTKTEWKNLVKRAQVKSLLVFADVLV